METGQTFKLNSRRTFLIGFAFFGILMLWQVYYYYCPLYLDALLTDKYGAGKYDYIIGIIMALDNIFAIFMIPLFGWLSDKTKTRLGRRMPYIVVGSLISLTLFPMLALMAVLNNFFWFLALMILIIIAMTFFRAPAVALMPDVTPKPLRARGNAIINFVGYVGAIIASLLTMIFVYKDGDPLSAQTATIFPFIITGVLMLIALGAMLVRFRENSVVASMRTEMERGEKFAETLEAVGEDKPLSRRDRANLIIIIAAVFFAYFAFNALNKFGSLYGTKVLGTSEWGLATAVLAASSLLTFIPSVKLTKKIGRKRSVLAGLLIIIIVMLAAGFIKTFGVAIIALFAISGVGWAIVNVNTYPMVVEMASRNNVGRYTGIYYMASQTAQALTSIVVGFVFDWLGLEIYFFYAVVFMALSLILCLFFKTKEKKAARQHA